MLLDVISWDPAILLVAVLGFEENVLVVFASHQANAWRNFLCGSRGLLRVSQKTLDRLTGDWLRVVLVAIQLSNRLHCAGLGQLGPELRKQRSRGVNIRAVDLAVDCKNVTDHV